MLRYFFQVGNRLTDDYFGRKGEVESFQRYPALIPTLFKYRQNRPKIVVSLARMFAVDFIDVNMPDDVEVSIHKNARISFRS